MRVTEGQVGRVVLAGTDGWVAGAHPLGEGETRLLTAEFGVAPNSAVGTWEAPRRGSMERMVAVQEAERGRIARDLHDEFGHLFASVLGKLSALQNCDSLAARQIAGDIRTTVREGIRVAHSVAWSLQPSGLEDLGLIACIEHYVEDCRRMYPLRIDLATPSPPLTVPAPVATAIFRIVQEALTNIGRHSAAHEASVMLVCSPHTMRVVIEDNGVGFDPAHAIRRRSLGLIGMSERARLIDGRLVVESRLGRGTTIVAEVPIRQGWRNKA